MAETAVYNRAINPHIKQVMGRNGEDVAVEDGEVGEFAGGDGALLCFLPAGGGCPHREGVDGFVQAEFLLGMPALWPWCAIGTTAGDSGVDATKRLDGFHGRVGAEDESSTAVEHGAPGVGVLRTLAPVVVGHADV